MSNPLVVAGAIPVAPVYAAGQFSTGLDTSTWALTPVGPSPWFAQPQYLVSQAPFADFAASGSFTFETWVYAGAGSAWRGWSFSALAPSAGGQGLSTQLAFQMAGSAGNTPYASGVVRFLVNGQSTFVDWRSPTQFPSTPAWHHVAVVISGPNALFYIDGAQAGSAAIGGYRPAQSSFSDASLPSLYVGSFALGIAPGPQSLCFDELALWNYARYSGSTYTVPGAPYADNTPGLVALYHFDGALSDSAIPPQATGLSLAGPAVVALGSPSAPYTVALAPAPASTPAPVTVTPSDGGAGGTFSPATIALSTDAPQASFTYTASAAGAFSLTLTNDAADPALADPDPLAVTVEGAASAYTMSGPASGAAGVPSAPFTIAFGAGTTSNGVVTIVPSDNLGGGAFSPTALVLSGAQPGATATYTPGRGGPMTLTCTNNGGLADPAPLVYTAQAGAATALSLLGPASGPAGTASVPFTVALYPVGGSVAGTVTVIPSDGGAGGTFTPTQVSLTTASPGATFTYTPPAGSATSPRQIGLTNSGGLVGASALYTVLGATSYVKIFAVQYGPAYSGLAAQIGYTVYSASGAVLVARTLGQTSEMAATGIYSASVPLDQSWNGVVVFDAPAEGVAPAAAEFDILLPSAPALIAL